MWQEIGNYCLVSGRPEDGGQLSLFRDIPLTYIVATIT